MTTDIYNVLFLCTGNSARSILAEAILSRVGDGKFQGFSAGSDPAGLVNPFAVKLLKSLNYSTDGFRSKNWDEFAMEDSPKIDFVFTVCDNAAAETCPIWIGHPMSAHWGLPDPAAVEGSDAKIAAAFAETYRTMSHRIEAFVNLPLQSLDKRALQNRLNQLAHDQPESA
jgi:arsenate reductase